MDNIFGNIGNAIGNAVGGIGNAVQNFTKPVQQFMGQANQSLQQLPNNPVIQTMSQNPANPVIQQMGNIVKPFAQDVPNEIQGISQQGMDYFNPQSNNGNNFWGSTNTAKILAGQQQMPKFDFAERMQQATQQTLGHNPVGDTATFGMGVLAGIPESILNVPSDIMQADINTARDVNTGQMNLQHGIADAASFASPLLTVATMGEGGSLLKELASDTWKQGLVKGLLNGVGYGGMFGALGGLQQGADTQSVQQQFEQAIPTTLQGMAVGGVLGSVLGPSGKFFFGGNEGDAAALSANNLVPPEVMDDAYKILGVSPEANLNDIRNAYTQHVQTFHPQVGGTDEALQALNNAYEMATRNVAPQVSFGEDGNPNVMWNDQFGGNLTPKQIAQARKAGSDNMAFQARMENLRSGNVPIRETPNQTIADDYLQHGSDLLTPEGKQAIQNKVQQASTNQPQFHDLLDTIASQTKGRSISNIKLPESIAEKVVQHRMQGDSNYGIADVNDALRGSIVVKPEDIDKTITALKSEVQARGWQMRGQGDNFFKNPDKNGYEGYHLDVGLPDGQIAEVQIHTPQSFANARFTHNVYDAFGDNIPKNVKLDLQNMQTKIKTDPIEQVELANKGSEYQNAQRVLSPIAHDFTGDTAALTQEGQIAKNLREANPNLDYTTLQEPENQAQQQRLNTLLQQRDTLMSQSQNAPQTTPEIEQLSQMKDTFQNELQQAQSFIAQNKNNPQVGRTLVKVSDMKAHIKDLQDNIKNIDTQVKDAQGKLTTANKAQTDRIKIQLADLDNQIKQERTRVGIQDTLSQQPKITGKTLGEIQEESQRAHGLGLLADYDEAARSGDTAKMQQIAQQVANQSDTSPYGPYKKSFADMAKSVTSELPDEETTAKSMPQPQVDPSLRDDYRFASQELGKQLNPVWKPDEFGRMYAGQKKAGYSIGRMVAQRIRQDLPQESWARVWEGAQDPEVFQTLSAKEKEVLGQVQQVLGQDAQVRQKYDPNFEARSNFMPWDVIGHDNTPGQKQQAFSTFSAKNLQRETTAFDPVNGGTPLVGSAEGLGLTTNGQTYEDAQGNQYVARNALPKEAESIGIQFNKNLPELIEKQLGDTYKFRLNSAVKEALQSGKYGKLASESPLPGYRQLDDPGLKGIWINGKLADAIEATNPNRSQNPATKLWDQASNATRNTIFYNALTHPLNMTMQALRGAAQQGPKGVMDLIGTFGDAAKIVRDRGEDYVAMQQKGTGIGSFGEKSPGLFSQVADKFFSDNTLAKRVGERADAFNPVRQLYQGNKALVGFMDDTLRTGLQMTLEKNGMDPRQAANEVNSFLVNYGDTNAFERNVVNKFGIFYPWLKGIVKNDVRMLSNPKQYAGSLAMAALQIGAMTAATEAFQQWTGNNHASLPFYGGASIEKDIAQAPFQMAQGEIPTIVSGHLNPLVQEIATQATNTSYFPDLFSRNKTAITKDTQTPQQQALTRLQHAEGALVAPMAKINPALAGRKTPLEAIANMTLRASTPHLQGHMAAPNWGSAGLPIVGSYNQKNAVGNTGMAVIDAQNQALGGLTDQEYKNYQQMKTDEQGGNYANANKAMISDPKLFAAKAQIEKASAQVNGIQPSPLYTLPQEDAINYLKYQNMTPANQAKYAVENPKMLDVDRQIDQYKSSPQYAQQQQQMAKQLGYTYKPYVSNPLYATGDNGQPLFPNAVLQDYMNYKQMSSGTTKTEFAANHPWIAEMEAVDNMHESATTQNMWNARPAGQSLASFMADHPTANIGAVDANGTVIPKTDYTHNPMYQLTPQQQSVALLYSAYTASGDTTAKRQLLAQNPWLPSYWNARTNYFANNPSGPSGGTGGLGYTFGSGSSSGGGYSSNYNSSNYLQNYLQREAIYGALRDTIPKPVAPKLTSKSGSTTGKAQASPLASYYKAQGNVAKILQSAPIQPPSVKPPKITAPRIKAVANKFKVSGGTPRQPSVQAGRMTKLTLK